MICLICTLELHARHELYSVADDSFDLDQLTPAELTRENLYASILPMVRCSTSPAKAFAAEQRERHSKRYCISKDGLSLPQLMQPSQVIAASSATGIGGPLAALSGPTHPEKATEVPSTAALPEALDGVKMECSLNFAPYAPVRSPYVLSSLSSLCAGMGRVGDNALAQALRAQRLNLPPDIDSDLSRQVSAMESYLSDLASKEAMVSLSRPPLPQDQLLRQQQRTRQPTMTSSGESSSAESSSETSSCSSSCSSSSSDSECSSECSSTSS